MSFLRNLGHAIGAVVKRAAPAALPLAVGMFAPAAAPFVAAFMKGGSSNNPEDIGPAVNYLPPPAPGVVPPMGFNWGGFGRDVLGQIPVVGGLANVGVGVFAGDYDDSADDEGYDDEEYDDDEGYDDEEDY